VKIIKNMPEKKILFVPDINLGSFVKKQCPDKDFKLMQGGCPRHAAVTKEEAVSQKKAHPNALLLVHPECKSEVADLADYVGSTTGIIDFAKKSDAKEFIIGTENSILQHLEYDCPDKTFYVLSKALICPNMKLTTLPGLYKCCTGEGGEEITLDEDIRLAAKGCIDRMIELEGK
jgi:quinolinate synthase